ncbi:hypothetical protein OG474_34275 [Kribbella sp. NBC_01505]|uniref:hypothetical protein n=1 Tax=Kribbella sp. NBC_01505 TaxID=2903580 RepID=UPI0038648681
MLIDCDACVMRGPGCQDCVVSVVLGFAAERHESIHIDDDERAALDVLAESGLVPPLRLVHAVRSVEFDAAAKTPDGEGETAVGSV